MSDDQVKAIFIGDALVKLWAGWCDEKADEFDTAMKLLVERAANELDLDAVDGRIAQPLNYFVGAYLREDNPEDLTYCEMLESVELGVKQLTGGTGV